MISSTKKWSVKSKNAISSSLPIKKNYENFSFIWIQSGSWKQFLIWETGRVTSHYHIIIVIILVYLIEKDGHEVCSISHRIWSQIYRIWNQFQFRLVCFQFCFDLGSNLKLKRNVFVDAVSEIRIHRIYFRLVSFFCESVSQLKSKSGSNADKLNTHVLKKPK